ncbi:MAG: hypothetical protein QM689_07005 [Oscillospiraceae bacterium]
MKQFFADAGKATAVTITMLVVLYQILLPEAQADYVLVIFGA